jgi:hypothetical protein
MGEKELKADDIVWFKFTRFPYWPCKVQASGIFTALAGDPPSERTSLSPLENLWSEPSKLLKLSNVTASKTVDMLSGR